MLCVSPTRSVVVVVVVVVIIGPSTCVRCLQDAVESAQFEIELATGNVDPALARKRRLSVFRTDERSGIPSRTDGRQGNIKPLPGKSVSSLLCFPLLLRCVYARCCFHVCALACRRFFDACVYRDAD